MYYLNPLLACDGYKLSHADLYPEGTTKIYSNFTPRMSRVPGVDRVVFFGLQAFLQSYLMDGFELFFDDSEDDAIAEIKAVTDPYVGENTKNDDRFRALHRLGYLPLEFKALPEGTRVPLRVPMFTVENTLPEFYWLTNFIETVLSAEIWQPMTAATLSLHLRELLNDWAVKTGGAKEAVDFQGHDFSYRGMEGTAAASASGAGHLLSFSGSDCVATIPWVQYYYPGDNGLIAASVPASEHSVICAGSKEDERGTFERALSVYPTGIISMVADTWDLWSLLTNILPAIKDQIMARDGKLVVRPDSGNPTDIICGTNRFMGGLSPEGKGVIELLWDKFGGTVNAAGFKELDSHVGAIYGDSINYDRANEICERLAAKGFASTNIVLGVGSYTYQFVTRDTFGFAMKATWAEINGEGRDLFKDPITDNGVKKSAKGRLSVTADPDDGHLILYSQASSEEEASSLLTTVWKDGHFVRKQSFADVRRVLSS